MKYKLNLLLRGKVNSSANKNNAVYLTFFLGNRKKHPSDIAGSDNIAVNQMKKHMLYGVAPFPLKSHLLMILSVSPAGH